MCLTPQDGKGLVIRWELISLGFGLEEKVELKLYIDPVQLPGALLTKYPSVTPSSITSGSSSAFLNLPSFSPLPTSLFTYPFYVGVP